MDLKAKSTDLRARCLALTCPRCRQATVRYWPDYDEPGEILSCPGCKSLYELTDGFACRIAPFDPDADSAPQPRRERRS